METGLYDDVDGVYVKLPLFFKTLPLSESTPSGEVNAERGWSVVIIC